MKVSCKVHGSDREFKVAPRIVSYYNCTLFVLDRMKILSRTFLRTASVFIYIQEVDQMNFLPELSEVKKIAATNKFNVVPVSCELLSDFTTPIETMKILKNVSTHCYMLESAWANDKWGRYTFLGFDPKMEITCIDGEIKAGNIRIKTDNPSDYLRQILADYKSPRFSYLPSFTGGLVGYFSYDYLGYSEPAVRCKVEDTEDFKDVDLMLFDKVIAFDNVRQKLILIVNMPLQDVEVGYNKAVMELKQLADLLHNGKKKEEPGGKLLGEVTPLFNKEQYCDMVEKAKREVEHTIKKEGERAILEVGIHNIHPELVKLLGKLHYRTSYGQNVLNHSLEVAYLAGLLAAELGEDETLARRAGLLHDIGKALDHEMEGSHIQLGVEVAKRYRESEAVVHAIHAHHGDVEAKTVIACLVQAADAISAARPGARRENIENYIKRLEKLEEIANSFNGVESSYAIQAGREVRIMVKPEVISDDQMVITARDIVKKIENELDYPGQVKVNVIRESRAVDYAK